MTAFIIRRLIYGMLILILVTILVFLAMRLLPGDPLMIYLAKQSQQKFQDLPPDTVKELRHQYGLDKPLIVQYINWMGDIVHGNLGKSYFYTTSINDLLAKRLPVTLYLGSLALIVSSVIGITIGILSAVKRGTWIDNIITPLTYVGITIPVFWLGILLIYVFGMKLKWLPIAGFVWPADNFWLSIRLIIMPVFCESIFGIASNARQMRSAMLEVIRQDYIRTAWAKGLKERAVIFNHALKNSLIPVITLVGMGVGGIVGGSVLIETVFAIPGVGRLMVNSIFNHDYLVVQAITLVIATAVLTINMLVDISYGWFDPRIRYS